MSAAHSVFKQCSKCSSAAATQTFGQHDASQLNLFHRRDCKWFAATCSSSSFLSE